MRIQGRFSGAGIMVRGAGLPKAGQRNGGLQLCISLHAVCRDLLSILHVDLQSDFMGFWVFACQFHEACISSSMPVICMALVDVGCLGVTCVYMASPQRVFSIRRVTVTLPCPSHDLWPEAPFV